MFHEVTIIGAIGRDPELRYTADGKAMCNFSLAANRNVAQGKKETIWFKVTTFDKMAESVNTYAKKGQKVFVVGRLVCSETGSPRTYTKQDGTTAASFEVVAREFRIVDFKTEADQGQTVQRAPQYQQRQTQPVQRTVQQNFAETDDIPW